MAYDVIFNNETLISLCLFTNVYASTELLINLRLGKFWPENTYILYDIKCGHIYILLSSKVSCKLKIVNRSPSSINDN